MLSLVITTLLISLAIQAFFFVFAAGFKTDKVTDLSYGLSFIILALFLLINQSRWSQVQILIAFLITLWGLRLAGYLFIRILKIKKDARFDGIRENFFKFAQFWLLQGIAVFVIMLPSLFLLTTQNPPAITWLTYLGSLIALLGLGLETIADWQKFNFKNRSANKDKFIQTGVWKYSRYPNYFGEMTFWWGLFLIVVPVLSGWQWLSLFGPVFITTLLLFVSGIPPLEKRYNQKFKNDPAYQRYKQTTSLLIPLPPKS